MMTDTAPTRRLRIQGLVVNVSLVWDDGEEMTPGPQLQPVALAPSQVAEFMAQLPEQVEALAAQDGEQPA